MLAMSAGEGPPTLLSRTGMLLCRSAGCQAAPLMLHDAWPKATRVLSHTGLGLAALAAYKGSIALVGTVLYVGSFALGAGAVPGLLVPEITPARLRGDHPRSHDTALGPKHIIMATGIAPSDKVCNVLAGRAVSLAMATHWIFNFSIGQLFLPAVTNFGLPSVYLFFACICALTVLYTRSQIVETRGLSLEEIEKQLAV